MSNARSKESGMRKFWLGIIGLAAASTANAAVVTYTLSLHEGVNGAESANGWALYATVSPGDNAGLFAFGVDLKGTGDAGGPTALAVTNRSPNGTWDADAGDPNNDGGVYTKFAGYGTGRGNSGVTGVISGVTDLAKGTDLVPVFGIGQQAVQMNNSKPAPADGSLGPIAYANYVPATGTDQNLGNPFNNAARPWVPAVQAGSVRLATGTFTGNLGFDLGSVNSKASVWKTSHPTGTENEIATLSTLVRDFTAVQPSTGRDFVGLANTADAGTPTNIAVGGAIAVTGANGSYVSEVDQLVGDPNVGNAPIQTIGNEAGSVYVMAKLTGTAADIANVLSHTTADVDNTDSQFALLHAAYDSQFGAGGFNALFKFPNITGAKVFSIETTDGAHGAVTVDQLAAVPEPTTMSLLGLGALGLLARRRRNA